MISVYHQGRLSDVFKFCVSFPGDLTPRRDCRALDSHRLRRTRRIHVLLSQVPALPKCYPRSLARWRWTKEEIEEDLQRIHPSSQVFFSEPGSVDISPPRGPVLERMRYLTISGWWARVIAGYTRRHPKTSTVESPDTDKIGGMLSNGSIMLGISPLEPATPALSNKITGRLASNPSVTAESNDPSPAR